MPNGLNIKTIDRNSSFCCVKQYDEIFAIACVFLQFLDIFAIFSHPFLLFGCFLTIHIDCRACHRQLNKFVK